MVTPRNIFKKANITFVRNSYDPNDKQVDKPKVDISEIDERLQYQVRFQNTGNAPALKVVVTDTLDALLDLSTIEIGGASHPFEVNFTDNNVLVWTFNEINLPDSTSDLEGSQGFFTFSVKMQPSVKIGDEILNKVNIFFDFNPPIITNAASTKILNLTGLTENALSAIKLYPNPSTGLVNIKTSERITSAKVYSPQGVLLKTFVGSSVSQINLTDLASGVYHIILSNNVNQRIVKQLVKD